MSEREQDERLHGRSLMVPVHAPDKDGLELAALDEARKFFGAEVRLEIVPDYQANALSIAPPEERYYAHITVREVIEP